MTGVYGNVCIAVSAAAGVCVHLWQRLHDSIQQSSHPCGHLQKFEHCRERQRGRERERAVVRDTGGDVTAEFKWVDVRSTSCYSENSHDPDDGWVYGQRCVHFQLLQCDAHDGQGHDSDIQLIPPEQVDGHLFSAVVTHTKTSQTCCYSPRVCFFYLSLKNLWMPNATNLSRASMTKIHVNT